MVPSRASYQTYWWLDMLIKIKGDNQPTANWLNASVQKQLWIAFMFTVSPSLEVQWMVLGTILPRTLSVMENQRETFVPTGDVWSNEHSRKVVVIDCLACYSTRGEQLAAFYRTWQKPITSKLKLSIGRGTKPKKSQPLPYEVWLEQSIGWWIPN